MAEGDYGTGARLRPLHVTVTIVPKDDGTYVANASAGMVAEVVSAADGRSLLPARNFEVPLSAAEASAVSGIVDHLISEVLTVEGISATYSPPPPPAEEAPPEAPAEAPAPQSAPAA